jgi:hypothetical protein
MAVGLGGYTTVPAPSTNSLQPWIQQAGRLSGAAWRSGSCVEDSFKCTVDGGAMGQTSVAVEARLDCTWQLVAVGVLSWALYPLREDAIGSVPRQMQARPSIRAVS